jgi:F1F0 ATPase subunit 2
MDSGTVSSTFAQVLRDVVPFVVLGALLGAGYFAALRQNVQRYVVGRPLGPTVALHLGRLVLTGLAFALIAGAGAAALLGALAGFLLARALAVRRVRIGT